MSPPSSKFSKAGNVFWDFVSCYCPWLPLHLASWDWISPYQTSVPHVYLLTEWASGYLNAFSYVSWCDQSEFSIGTGPIVFITCFDKEHCILDRFLMWQLTNICSPEFWIKIYQQNICMVFMELFDICSNFSQKLSSESSLLPQVEACTFRTMSYQQHLSTNMISCQ